MKKLYKSRTNRMVAGVCGGIAEYFNVDPTLVRIIAVLALIPGAFVGTCIAYVICSAVIPQE